MFGVMPGGRGGRRRGTPGKAYSQRVDLNDRRPLPVMTAPSTSYGQAAASAAAQKAVPLAPQPGPAVQPTEPSAPAGPLPGAAGDFLRPTERPAEPLTSGIAGGAGPGPEALGQAPDGTVDELRALYASYPNEDLRQLLEDIDEGVI